MSVEGESPAIVLGEDAAPRPGWHRWTRGLGFAFVGLVIVGLAALLGYGMLNKEDGRSSLVTKEAPDFTLELFDGGTFTLSENRGQPVVMNVWASWCESCRAEQADVEQVWRSYKDQGVLFVGVNVMDTDDAARDYLEEFNVTYPNGRDRSNIYGRYGGTGTPETFFIDREGMVAHEYLGPLNYEQMSAFVEELLK
jgi:cytochrome c biogenesis protein CcmG/thiol:disulfide interchange protein DsbE